MTVRKVSFAINEFYHLYSRGVDKRAIFIDENDKKRFLRLLYLCNGTKPVVYKDIKDLNLINIGTGDKLVAIGAYCLMPNHFHILVKEIVEGGISKFMGKLLTAYSSYFNKKYDRNGSLFSSEFKSSHADQDEYLKYLFAYIHLNPVKIVDQNWRDRALLDKELIKTFLGRYYFSSFLDYSGFNREEGLILNKIEFPQYFINKGDFLDEIYGWLSTAPNQALPLEG